MALDRRAVVAELLRDAADTPGGELLVVTGLGSSTYDAGAAGDRDLNFYLWGAMGGAAMIGLGMALAQPARRVLVLTGDGEMLMGLGSLATIAALKPANLSIAVLDNGQFGETGQQRSHTALGADLAAIAAGCGWATTCEVRDMAGVAALRPRLRGEAMFAVVHIAGGEVPRHLPPRDGAHLAHRFRDRLGIVD
ncbi:MAG: aldehyde dehydrogenase [Rhodospirillales bacterium]|nr:aldehyde dehydrogenase [Rhodospirillales bacterium]MDE2198775.1 aldehyde dehydrogenase [Rhodospirillales bacterium]MDE2574282.1 aldehyde dehydrogenase [Rhodospirillales bacterium]